MINGNVCKCTDYNGGIRHNDNEKNSRIDRMKMGGMNYDWDESMDDSGAVRGPFLGKGVAFREAVFLNVFRIRKAEQDERVKDCRWLASCCRHVPVLILYQEHEWARGLARGYVRGGTCADPDGVIDRPPVAILRPCSARTPHTPTDENKNDAQLQLGRRTVLQRSLFRYGPRIRTRGQGDSAALLENSHLSHCAGPSLPFSHFNQQSDTRFGNIVLGILHP